MISEVRGKLVAEVEMGESSKGQTNFNKDNVVDAIPQDLDDVMKYFGKYNKKEKLIISNFKMNI